MALKRNEQSWDLLASKIKVGLEREWRRERAQEWSANGMNVGILIWEVKPRGRSDYEIMSWVLDWLNLGYL